MTAAQDLATSHAKVERKAISQSFAEWVETAVAGGARVAHEWVRRREPWVPSLCSDPVTGKSTSNISTYLALRCHEWGTIWNAQESCVADEVLNWDALRSVRRLPDIPVSDIRRASADFRRQTDNRDGFHPRHFCLLPDLALQSMSGILLACELTGIFPPQLESLVVALVPKPGGGDRPIGLFRATFRLWQRCRRRLYKDWQRSQASDRFFAGSKQRSALDVSWRRAFRAESESSGGGLAVSALWDLRKCYDHVQHHLLAAFAIRVGFPCALLRLTLRAYRWPRILLKDGVVSRTVWPRQSIVAGVTAATYELRALLVLHLREHVATHPLVRLNMFIDDASQDCNGKSSAAIASAISSSSRDLWALFEVELSLPVADSKCVIVGSHVHIVRSVSRSLGRLGKICVYGARDLGVDFTAGRLHSRVKGSTRAVRCGTLLYRYRRIKRLAKVR